MSTDFDISDIVASDDKPPLQAFRNSSSFDMPQGRPAVPLEDQHPGNHVPLQLLRRASETVNKSILGDIEPEVQHLLGASTPTTERLKRPLPPPRLHGSAKLTTSSKNKAKPSAQQQQPQPNNKVLSQSDSMTQNGNNATSDAESGTHTTSLHTKLDIQKFSEDYSNAAFDGDNGVDGTGTGTGTGIATEGGSGDAPQNVATIILTQPSLNLTNATQNTNGAAFPARDEEYKGPKWWRHLVAHWSLVSEHVAMFAIFLGLWSMTWVLLRDLAVPSTVFMRIVLLFVGAQLSGILVTFLNLPDMLGMLFFGVLYGNVGWANFEGYQAVELFLREMALVNIMLLAGLGLDGNSFRRLWLMIMRLALLPTIAEVAVLASLARFTLGMSWLWGIALGLVITAVSPNVVVTVMLKLKEERLGLNSGIHTLIYAMTTCNDVASIFMFGVVISVIFSTGSFLQQVMQGPIGIGIGVVFGYLYGMMLQYLPSRNAVYVNSLRFVLTILGGTIAVMGSRAIGYTSAGALGCVSMVFIANIGWKREEHKWTPHQALVNKTDSVTSRLDLLWKFLKPVSFALIGKEINFGVLEGRVIGYGALLVLVGSLFRLLFAYLSTYGGNLSRKERAYIAVSGFPKATVQAALGPVALDLARAALAPNESQLALASNVLIISVLAIIFTAPLGAILMLRLAPLWLKRSDNMDENELSATPETLTNSYKN